MTLHGHVAALLILMSSPLRAQTVSTPAQTFIGQGRGVDHVGVVVRDLAQAQHDYEQLGFKVSKGGHFPGGVSNSVVYFQNDSYLELLTVNGTNSTRQSDAAELANFLGKHEGAMFLGINVWSAKGAADYLKAHNFDVAGPDPGSIMVEGQTTPPPPMWFDVGVNDKPAAGKEGLTLPVFFVEYVSGDRRMEKRRAQGSMDHANTAMRIHAVWFAVHDVQAQSRTLHTAGFKAGTSREAKFIGGHGQEVMAGQGVLVLLESSENNTLLAKYLSDHDEGIIGLSIEVADLGKARRLAEAGTGGNLETYQGFYGTSFMLPPSVTHGVWIEMYQPVEHSQ
jgi:catechol 2,3-dioxygenase-like lactoylglutathione lyase family enzyme